jgi:tetratricopeptide (TPR) repeat protein
MSPEDDLAAPALVSRHRIALRLWKRWTRRDRKQAAEHFLPAAGQAAFAGFNRAVALAAVGDTESALVAYRQVLRVADGDLAAKAVFNLAVLQSHDLDRAAAAYRAAIETGHVDAAPKAAYNLGCMLQQAGCPQAAADAFQKARSFGHERVTADATIKLGELSAVADTLPGTLLVEFSPRLVRYQRRSDHRLRGHRHNWLPSSTRFSGRRRARGSVR